MKISVIIPTCKPLTYFEDCLQSLKRQTFAKEDFEIIIGLNGCNEPYYIQIKEYVEKELPDYNITLLQDNRGGASVGRNIGLDIAKGDYITFIDDDDYVSDSYLSDLYAVVSKDTIAISYALSFCDNDKDNKYKYHLSDAYCYCTEHGYNKLTSRARQFFSGPVMKLIPRDIIGDRRFNLGFKRGEDCIFNFLISDRIVKVAFATPDAIYYRRLRPNSLTTNNRKVMEDVNLSLKSIKEYTRIFFSGNYSVYFYMTRLAAEVRSILIAPFRKNEF